ncbi:hypothetical protein GOP47_0015045 [Adiantum capillus-veneris]|uniref:C2H2-type domain-containing protein n=1 Tax=Adiantum capillus-veneris TaxID=13818 RepID=A0A9D4ZE32_ADICA|nr:hypothetical protein GOP47_0015045 [Adiantum capillus-veneris]
MKRSGFEDPEQQQILMHVPRHHQLHDSQKFEMNGGTVVHHSCMLTNEAELITLPHSQAHIEGGDRLEGEVLISNRQKVFLQEAAAFNRHSCLGEAAASAWQGPKTRESSAPPETSRDPAGTQRPDLVRAKHAGELSDEGNMGLSTKSDLKLPGNLSRTGITCRICNKQFPSGRALGGHMRVHGPLFAPASTSLSRISVSGPRPAANLTHREVANECTARDEEDNVPPSIIDALDAAELEQDLPLQDGRSALEASSTNHGADELLDHDNGYAGELDAHHADTEQEKDLNIDVESRRFVSLVNYNSRISHLNRSTEEARIEAAKPPTAARSKSLLYKLRHNPKRSRWFADQEFAFEASMANSSGKNSPSVEGNNVCPECGKDFWSERALFGHMRCHPDRDRRIALTRVESINSEKPGDTMARQRRKLSELVAQNSEMQIGSKKAEVYRKWSTEMEALREFRNEALSGIEVIGTQELADKTEGEGAAAHKEQSGCISSSIIMNDEVAPARWQVAGRRSRRKVGLSKAGTMENRATSSSSPDEPALTSESISLELGAVEEQEIQTPDFLILLADAARKIEEETELTLSREKSFHFRTDVKRSKHQQIVEADHRLHSKDVHVDKHEDVPPVQDLLNTGVVNAKYECTTCKKSFNSHQALGGHRASHKKTKGCFAQTGSSEAREEQSLQEELELRHVQEKGKVMAHKKSRQQTQQGAAAFKGHVCSICHRIFLTGQALGGHKRCHWTGDQKPSEAASIVSTNKQLSLQSEGQSVVEGGIDLNMPAPMDEDADEVGFVPTEMHSIKSEVVDQDGEDEKANMDGSDLVLGTSALAWGAVKDLLEDDTRHSSSLRKETEARHRFDGIWGQHWPNNIGVTPLGRPMYAMQSLV